MTRRKSIDQKKAGAGLAGAGGGTLLLTLVNSLDDTNSAKQWLLLSVPTVSVVGSYVFLFAFRQTKTWWTRRKLNSEQRDFEKVATIRLNDPNTSNEHKIEIRKKLEEFQKIDIDNRVKKVKALAEENDQSDLSPSKVF